MLPLLRVLCVVWQSLRMANQCLPNVKLRDGHIRGCDVGLAKYLDEIIHLDNAPPAAASSTCSLRLHLAEIDFDRELMDMDEKEIEPAVKPVIGKRKRAVESVGKSINYHFIQS